MTFNLTEHDQNLVTSIELSIESQGVARPIDGFPDGGGGAGGAAERGLTEASQKLLDGTQNPISSILATAANVVRLASRGAGGKTVRFQFPARLKSDQKDARWESILDAPTYEPSYMFLGGGPRRIQLHTIYLVGGPSSAGQPWTTKNVANEIKRLKSYFYIGGPTHDFLPVFKLKLYNHVPAVGDKSAWRGRSISITPSEELIQDSDGIYALKSEVILSLEMVTNITSFDGQSKYPFTNVPPKTLHQWY